MRRPLHTAASSSFSGHAMVEDSRYTERPRLEPEIIPPRRTRGDSDWPPRDWRPYISAATGTHRLYVGRLGPFGFAVIMLVIGILAAAILLAVLGAILIWIPILALLLAAGAIFRLLRR
jgi:hypothetical protein